MTPEFAVIARPPGDRLRALRTDETISTLQARDAH